MLGYFRNLKQARVSFLGCSCALISMLLVCIASAHAESREQATKFIPYYASFKSGEVNMRVGPSTDHPIVWVYHRQGLPVRIIDAHLEWRQVVDPFGDKGWVKKSLLSPRRTALTTTKNVALRVHPSGSSATLANVEEGVVCIIKECSLQWCQVDAGNYRGWIQRQALWGIEPREVIK